jgi:hypothetical protein
LGARRMAALGSCCRDGNSTAVGFGVRARLARWAGEDGATLGRRCARRWEIDRVGVSTGRGRPIRHMLDSCSPGLGPFISFRIFQLLFQFVLKAPSPNIQHRIFLVSKILQTWHVDINSNDTALFLAQLQNLSRFWIIKFGSKSRLNLA